MKVDEVKQLTNEALEELIAALETDHSEALTTYLKTMSLFSKYSLNNLFLIARQGPDARRVAGYETWRKLGRYVRKGEKGIAIIAPMIRRESEESSKQTTDQRVIAGFKIAHIFSEEQTDGEPLAELGTVTGDPSAYFAKPIPSNYDSHSFETALKKIIVELTDRWNPVATRTTEKDAEPDHCPNLPLFAPACFS